VGIGTNSPDGKLHVVGANDQIRGGDGTSTSFLGSSGGIGYTGTLTNHPFDIYTNSASRIRIDSSGNVGIGVTPSAWSSNWKAMEFGSLGNTIAGFISSLPLFQMSTNYYVNSGGTDTYAITGKLATQYLQNDGTHAWKTAPSGTAGAAITFTQAMTLNASGNLLVGKTAATYTSVGCQIMASGQGYFTASGADVLAINRLASNGTLVGFYQSNTQEGSISVSGTTVSYNGGHLARWSQLLDGSKDESILKGTVLSNLDEMCVWEKDGVVAENEQLNKMKVSDVEGDTNVAGVFVNWTKDEDYNSDDMNIAMTGDMIIRIAEGVTVQRGDLLMSAGDGTAKPQGDDIVRGKTIAKVTSTNITCTYADGSYCVPCVLMAC
jgi:hypothetical protein